MNGHAKASLTILTFEQQVMHALHNNAVFEPQMLMRVLGLQQHVCMTLNSGSLYIPPVYHLTNHCFRDIGDAFSLKYLTPAADPHRFGLFTHLSLSPTGAPLFACPALPITH